MQTIEHIMNLRRAVVQRWACRSLKKVKFFPKNVAKLWDEIGDIDIPEIPEFNINIIDNRELEESLRSKRVVLTSLQEKYLFLGYNYSRSMLSSFRGKEPYRKRQLERMYDIWLEVKRYESLIVNANIALVLAMANLKMREGDEFCNLVEEGMITLLRAVRSFNVGLGFKFSTYACRSVIASFGRRRSSKFWRNYHTFQLDEEVGYKADVTPLLVERVETEKLLFLRRLLDEGGNLASLTEMERLILSHRWLAEQKKTLEEIGNNVGVSKERIRQIELSAMKKLRLAFQASELMEV